MRAVVSLSLAVLFATPAAGRAHDEIGVQGVLPASDEAAAALSGFELAEGLTVDLFAAEPMLANPVCLYVADDGAVYVGETFRHHAGVTDIREHMDWLDDDLASNTVQDRLDYFAKHLGDEYASYAEREERVRVLRDTDGDGVADVDTVFADGFASHEAGIGAGLLAHDGDVYYTCIPSLWRLRDEDGDDVADVVEDLHTGFGVRVALLGHDLHGLRVGPDMRLWFSMGDRGYHVQTPEGETLANPGQGAVFRCELDGSNLEVVHTGLRNPQELVFDDHGNLWTGENNSDSGDEARWVWIVPGGDSGWRQPFQWLSDRGPWNREKLWHPAHEGQAGYIVPPIANLADGPSGLTYEPGTALGERWRGHFLLCDFLGGPSWSGIRAFDVTEKGASFELGEVEDLVSNMLPTDADFGPDGGLYWTDWVDGWNKTGKGRVYRLSSSDADDRARAAATGELLRAGFDQRDADELFGLLGHADQRVRLRAQWQLVERGLASDGPARAALDARLQRLACDAEAPRLPRLHALWALSTLERRAPDVTNALVTAVKLIMGSAQTLGDDSGVRPDDDAEVRAQAMAVVPAGEPGPLGVGGPILTGLADSSDRVRFFAALAAGRAAFARAVPELVALLAENAGADPYLRHAAVMGLHGAASAAELDALARHDSEHVRHAVALVLRRRADPALVQFLWDEAEAVQVEAARAIHDLPVRGGLAALASLAPELAGATDDLAQRVIAANLRLGAERHGLAVGGIARDGDVDVDRRVDALDALADWHAPSSRDRVWGAWRPVDPRDGVDVWRAPLVAELAADVTDAQQHDDIVREWIALADAVFVEGGQATPDVVGEVLGVARALVDDESRDERVRVDALRLQARLDPATVQARLPVLLADPSGAVRAEALDVLVDLAPAEALPRLPEILAFGELSERRVALDVLARAAGSEAVSLVVQQLDLAEAGLLPDELLLEVVLAGEAHADAPQVAERLQRHRARRAADPLLRPWLYGLHGGDPDAGREIFERNELACVRCHAADADERARVGPTLAGVGARLGRLPMLESIVDPNRRIVPGYQGTNLWLAEGGVLSGRLVADDGHTLQLLDADGLLHELAATDVDDRTQGLSAMPEGLGEGLSREEMRDLLAYLAGL